MNIRAAFRLVSELGLASCGLFTSAEALAKDVGRDQITRLLASGAIERVHAGVYRVAGVPRSAEQSLRAALLWIGDDACADARSACGVYALDCEGPTLPEIVVPAGRKFRADAVVVRRVDKPLSLMAREVRGIRVVGPETTMLSLGRVLDGESLEIACEDARRKRLTSIPALRSFLAKYGRDRPGAAALRRLLDDLDPVHPARSTLEVKARRLLVAHGLTDFVREFPLTWNDRTYRYDFGFPNRRVILETNGRRWHDDAADYEHDHEKWSVPGRLGYRIVLATWAKVTRERHALLAELTATLAA